MQSFFAQPHAFRFGTEFIHLIESGEWDSIGISVAWVRRSGMKHIRPALVDHLKRGARLDVISGIDIKNTSYEGLQGLIELEQYGSSETHVHHNENAYIFHPKIYLFENEDKSKLIVASSNLTEAGLYKNTEAALVIDAEPNDQVIADAKEAMDAWKDPSTGLAQQLTDELLAELLANGYLEKEESLRSQYKASAGSSKKKKKSLFGRVTVSAPAVKSDTDKPKKAKAKKTAKKGKVSVKPTTIIAKPKNTASSPGSVLIMRVRKASATARPTQTQIPIRVYKTKFFDGATNVESSHDGDKHTVIEARARGIVNTLKLEIPEIRTYADPVVRFERTDSGIVYEAYDAASPKGRLIMKALQDGRTKSPPLTSLTVPSNPTSATWWRFI